jgi:hypothetical protein
VGVAVGSGVGAGPQPTTMVRARRTDSTRFM